MCIGPADVTVEGQLELAGRCLGDGQTGAEDRVGAEAGLVVGPVEVAELGVDQALLEGVDPASAVAISR